MSLGAIVDVVAGKIGQLLIEEARLLFDVKDQVKRLEEELLMMSTFVHNMEGEGYDSPTTETVYMEIRQIAFDAEDLLDCYISEVEGRKKEGFLNRYSCFRGSSSRLYTLASKIKSIEVRIDGIVKGKKMILGENGDRIEGRDQGEKRPRFRAPVTYPHTIEQHAVGLEEDINKLLRTLRADDTRMNVVSIVGIGGSGKTTLARKLYNHELVKSDFDYKAWLSVSKEWGPAEILLELLEKASGQTMRAYEAFTIQEVAKRLRHYLERKRYFIVLDDVWEKEALEGILQAFPFVNAPGKIVVTTRKRGVADFPDLKCIDHEMRRLCEEESWELFEKIAFFHREESSNPADMSLFEALGKEMLKICEGLPLAVIALAGILCKKETVGEWQTIKKAVCSRITEDGRGTCLYGPVNKMLALSYTDLPHEIKPCFLYLANFPADYDIDANQLIRMWIAEGFITSDKLHERDTLQDLAQGYLDELIHCCLVQIARKNYDGTVSSICMHDLVRDLCIKEAKQQDFIEVFTFKAPDSHSAAVTKSRRMAVHIYDGVHNPCLTRSQPLRSLICHNRRVTSNFPNVDLQLICQNFRLLRVLDLQNIDCSYGTLPTEIGSLKHLRYLGLRGTNIINLPSSIGNLHNLQTLQVNHEYEFGAVRIPDVFWKIRGLKHLDMDNAELIEGKLKLDTLKSLQTLWGIRGGDWMLKELPLLSQSVQNLKIYAIRSTKQLEAAFQCPSMKFDRLHSLYLGWGSAVIMKNLEPIIHCQHLRELYLLGRVEYRLAGCDIQFPSCIKVLKLHMSCFEAEGLLVALGKLPGLIILKLFYKSYVGTKWTCFAGAFPQLKQLQLDNLENLEEWSVDKGAMPQLSNLTVHECKNLGKLPEGLKFITHLQEVTLDNMSDEFNKRLKGGKDAHIIQHVPIVHVWD